MSRRRTSNNYRDQYEVLTGVSLRTCPICQPRPHDCRRAAEGTKGTARLGHIMSPKWRRQLVLSQIGSRCPGRENPWAAHNV